MRVCERVRVEKERSKMFIGLWLMKQTSRRHIVSMIAGLQIQECDVPWG